MRRHQIIWKTTYVSTWCVLLWCVLCRVHENAKQSSRPSLQRLCQDSKHVLTAMPKQANMHSIPSIELKQKEEWHHVVN